MTSKLAKFEFQQGFHRETTQFAEGDKWFDGNRVLDGLWMGWAAGCGHY